MWDLWWGYVQTRRMEPLVERVPHLLVLGLLAAFAVQGTAIPISATAELVFRVTAALCCLPLVITIVLGDTRWNLVAGAMAVAWMVTWGVQVIETGNPQTSLSSMMLWPTIAVLVAWSWGKIRMTRSRPRRPRRTPPPGKENVSAHYSSVRGRNG